MTKSKKQTDARQKEEAVVGTGKKEEVGGGDGITDQRGGNTMKHLYRVTSKINGIFSHGYLYDEVPVSWECRKRDYPIVHPEEAIKDYRNQGYLRYWARDELGQLFSEGEAEALKEYLSEIKENTMTTIEKVDLPLPLVGIDIFVKQDTDKDYRMRKALYVYGWDYDALPFEAVGYYDVRDGVKRRPGLSRNCGNKLMEGQR